MPNYVKIALVKISSFVTVKRFFKHLLFIVLSIFLSHQISASSPFFSIEKRVDRVYNLADGASDWVKFLDDPIKANKFSDEIIEINKLTEGGGNLLSGTPASAINTAGYYNTVAEQGASIFKTIIKNHMFIDGNKRTAVEMFKSFCSKSNIRLTLNDSQLMDVATKVATGKIDDVLEISKNLVK